MHGQAGQHDHAGPVRGFPYTAGYGAAATSEQIYPYIKSISHPNNKAKNLAGMARMLCEEFGGEVPS